LNPHAQQSASFPALLASIWRNRQLIVQMSKREVMGRYSASMMGLTWSVLNPLMMLVVYTFVFSVVFKARWGAGEETRTQFALVLFTGLIVHGLLAEVLMRAPGVVVSNMNYVKKVVFPLEVLPVITMAGALFHGFVSVLVLLVANLLLNGVLHWTAALLPLVLLPLVILALGLAWILASIGVFVRDVGQVIGLLMTVLLFMSPVFYPISTLPPSLRPWMMFNPLTFIIEQARQVVIWGALPDVRGWLVYMLIAALVAWAGFFWFQRTRKGFADVL
jgi:lipopolysaccharide transport system permease protein